MSRPGPRQEFTQRTLIAAGIVTAIALALLLLWSLAEVWLLLFAGLIFAIFLRALTRPLARHLRIGDRLAYALAVALVLLLMAWLLVSFVPLFGNGLLALIRSLPEALRRLAGHLDRYEWGRDLLDQAANVSWAGFTKGTLSRLEGLFSNTLAAVAAATLVFMTGLYLAAEPQQYMGGTLALFPPDSRLRVQSILLSLRRAMEWWLFGRMASMLLVGLLTWAGLRALQTPHAATLALLAMFLSFIPILGALLSAIPAVVVGAGVSPITGGNVLLLYLFVHLMDAYLIGPLITRHTIRLPPATLLIMQIAFTALYGFLGLLLAGPLTVVLMVVIKTIYVRQVLEEPTALP